mmetsp:Transcript_54968/g.131338  ORF Transcript_54968/g.131338 Transcript_54968/m.131338 type:complete len:287 (-) Transcript_54968:933-1793(-)
MLLQRLNPPFSRAVVILKDFVVNPGVAIELLHGWMDCWLVQAQEKVQACLLFAIGEGVVVVAMDRRQQLFRACHHARTASQKLVLFVGDRSSILQGKVVAHDIVKLAQHENCLAFKVHFRLGKQAHCRQLLLQNLQAHKELQNVGTVQAVHTIRANHAVLQPLRSALQSCFRVEEADPCHHRLRQACENLVDRGIRLCVVFHVEGPVQNPVIFWKLTIHALDGRLEIFAQANFIRIHLLGLHKVDHELWSAIPLKQVSKVSACSRQRRVTARIHDRWLWIDGGRFL